MCINSNYWVSKDNGEVVEMSNEICFSRMADLIEDQVRRLGFQKKELGSEADKWGVGTLRSGERKLVSLRCATPVFIQSQRWLDFLCNLPIFKGKVEATFHSEIDITDKASPFSVMKDCSPEHRSSEIKGYVGYLDHSVTLEDLSAEMSFSFLSCIRYARDFPHIIWMFDHMVEELGFHPYLAFIVSSNVTVNCELIENFGEHFKKVGLDKVLRNRMTGSGHHTLTSTSSMSVALLDLLYHKKYPVGAALPSYSRVNKFHNIRFHSPYDFDGGLGRAVIPGKLGRLIDIDSALVSVSTPGRGTRDSINILKIDVGKANKVIEDLIVTTATEKLYSFRTGDKKKCLK